MKNPRLALALFALAHAGCVPLLAPHGEGRTHVGFTAGSTRLGASDAVRLTGTIDAVYQPTQLLGCDREVDLALGARFHFVEPEALGLRPARIGGVISGSWLFLREPDTRGSLRVDVDVLELDGRALAGVSLALGIELVGFAEGAGAVASWEALFAGAWSGEAGFRAEAMVSYHEDFGGVRYATFTVGLVGRFPAGAGVGIVNPIFLAVIAAQGSSPPSSSAPSASPPTASPSRPLQSQSNAAMRRCPDLTPVPLPNAEGAEDGGARVPRYRCHPIGDEGTEEHVDADSWASAMRACETMMGTVCACSMGPELMLED